MHSIYLSAKAQKEVKSLLPLTAETIAETSTWMHLAKLLGSSSTGHADQAVLKNSKFREKIKIRFILKKTLEFC